VVVAVVLVRQAAMAVASITLLVVMEYLRP
jgi:hypothetical protein